MTLVSVETQVFVMIAQVITVGLLNKRMEKKTLLHFLFTCITKILLLKCEKCIYNSLFTSEVFLSWFFVCLFVCLHLKV